MVATDEITRFPVAEVEVVVVVVVDVVAVDVEVVAVVVVAVVVVTDVAVEVKVVVVVVYVVVDVEVDVVEVVPLNVKTRFVGPCSVNLAVPLRAALFLVKVPMFAPMTWYEPWSLTVTL